MAEEDTTVIREIALSPYGHSTVDEVIRLLRDLAPAEQIQLTLILIDCDGFRLSDTVELRELVLEKKSQIQRLVVNNGFEFLVHFLWANNGATTHFQYTDSTVPLQLEQATGLSNAIRSNNNGNIESFNFSGCCESREVFQPIWEALLATRVRDLRLFIHFQENNDVNGGGNSIDFSNISTNTSLKELQLEITLSGTNLFDSIKSNPTVEKLIVNSRFGIYLDDRGNRKFLEMLVENTTLIHVELTDGHYNPILQEEIHIHTTVNQIWKRLLIIKRKERMAAATATATASIITTTATVAIAVVAVDDAAAAVERMREQDNNIHEVEKMKKITEEKKIIKEKKEMNLWLKTFEKKPAICNELIYLFLTKNADRYSNNVTSSIVVGEKRKRKRYKNNGTI